MYSFAFWSRTKLLLLLFLGMTLCGYAQSSSVPVLKVQIDYQAEIVQEPYHFYLTYKSGKEDQVLRADHVVRSFTEDIQLLKPGVYEVALGWPIMVQGRQKGVNYLWKNLILVHEVREVTLKASIQSDRYNKQTDVNMPQFKVELIDPLHVFRDETVAQMDIKSRSRGYTKQQQSEKIESLKKKANANRSEIKKGIVAFAYFGDGMYTQNYRLKHDTLLVQAAMEVAYTQVEPISLLWSWYVDSMKLFLMASCTLTPSKDIEARSAYLKTLLNLHPDANLVKTVASQLFNTGSSCFGEELTELAWVILESRFNDTFAFREAERTKQVREDLRRARGKKD